MLSAVGRGEYGAPFARRKAEKGGVLQIAALKIVPMDKHCQDDLDALERLYYAGLWNLPCLGGLV